MSIYRKASVTGAVAFILIATSCYVHLSRALHQQVLPVTFYCLSEENGRFLEEYLQFEKIYGIGLTYANHINETASDIDLDIGPPVFQKSIQSLAIDGQLVEIPSHQELHSSAEQLEPEISNILQNKEIKLSALLDYEVELAFVLLEDISKEALNDLNFVPKIGFFIANDLSARSVAILGEGRENRYDYWGVSKSFPGFSPISGNIWIPSTDSPDAIPCVTLRTYVNGELRQKENTQNLIYRPVDMLRFIQRKFPSTDLIKGDIILTGTPGGVIFNIPRWKVSAANILGLSRFQKLAFAQTKASAEAFLKPGDSVRVSGDWLGGVTVKMAKRNP